MYVFSKSFVSTVAPAFQRRDCSWRAFGGHSRHVNMHSDMLALCSQITMLYSSINLVKTPELPRLHCALQQHEAVESYMRRSALSLALAADSHVFE
jgi:hypothetical protein